MMGSYGFRAPPLRLKITLYKQYKFTIQKQNCKVLRRGKRRKLTEDIFKGVDGPV